MTERCFSSFARAQKKKHDPHGRNKRTYFGPRISGETHGTRNTKKLCSKKHLFCSFEFDLLVVSRNPACHDRPELFACSCSHHLPINTYNTSNILVIILLAPVHFITHLFNKRKTRRGSESLNHHASPPEFRSDHFSQEHNLPAIRTRRSSLITLTSLAQRHDDRQERQRQTWTGKARTDRQTDGSLWRR